MKKIMILSIAGIFTVGVLFLQANPDITRGNSQIKSIWISLSGPQTCCLKQVETIIEESPGVISVERETDRSEKSRLFRSGLEASNNGNDSPAGYLYHLRIKKEAFKLIDLQKSIRNAGKEHDERLKIEDSPTWTIIQVPAPANHFEENKGNTVDPALIGNGRHVPESCCPVNFH